MSIYNGLLKRCGAGPFTLGRFTCAPRRLFFCRFLPHAAEGFSTTPTTYIHPSQTRFPSSRETGPRKTTQGRLVPTNSLWLARLPISPLSGHSFIGQLKPPAWPAPAVAPPRAPGPGPPPSMPQQPPPGNPHLFSARTLPGQPPDETLSRLAPCPGCLGDHCP